MNFFKKKWHIYLIAGLLVLVAIVVMLVLFIGKNTPAPTTLSLSEAQGKTLFLANCNGCHVGEGRQGSLIATPLSTIKLDEAGWIASIKDGKGTMPPFHSLSDQEVASLVSYLKAIRRVAE